MDLLYMTCCEKLRERGVVSKQASMVLYAMAAEGLSYEAARDAYADFTGQAPEQLQASLCYDVLRAGLDGMPAALFAEMIGEGGGLDENGVPSAKGD